MKGVVPKILMAVALGITIFVGCFNDKAKKKTVEEENRVHAYYYYPKANVYYDSTEGNFIFYVDSSETWQSSKQLPEEISTSLGKSVEIENPSNPVWKNNDRHRMIYAVSLYATPADLKEKQIQKDTVATAGVQPEIPQEKKEHESGVKRFFKKLFGKKENKQP